MSSGLRFAERFHRWTYDWIAPHIRGRILDIGGGTGNHLTWLTDREVVSIDLSEDCVAMLAARHRDRPNWRFLQGDITEPGVVDRLGPSSFDTVLSCNVFEHIRDDDTAFLHAAQLLRPGGSLVLVLPAHPFLFGSMDRLAGHFRRYSRADVQRKLQRAGLTPTRLRHVNLLGALAWFVNGRLIRHQDLSSSSINSQIRVFDRWLIPVLRRIEGDRDMRVGQSLICVGSKPE